MSGQRIAIFGDLHGNSAATEAVLGAIDTEAPDAMYCLGDLVGYGPARTRRSTSSANAPSP